MSKKKPSAEVMAAKARGEILADAKAALKRTKETMESAARYLESLIPVGSVIEVRDDYMAAGSFKAEVISHGGWWAELGRLRVINVQTQKFRKVSLLDVICIYSLGGDAQ